MSFNSGGADNSFLSVPPVFNKMVTIFSLIAGVILLCVGRKVFWALVGALGFFAGIKIFSTYFIEVTGWAPWVVSIILGVIGAFLTIRLKRAAMWIIGMLAGIYIGIIALNMFNVDMGALSWIIILGGGIVGSAIVSILFEWSLIILSSVAGALLITSVSNLGNLISAALMIILVIGGVIIQSRKKK